MRARQQPSDEQQPDPYWNLKGGWQAADPRRHQGRVEKAPGHDTPSHPNHDDGAWSGKQNVRQSTEEVFRRRQGFQPRRLYPPALADGSACAAVDFGTLVPGHLIRDLFNGLPFRPTQVRAGAMTA